MIAAAALSRELNVILARAGDEDPRAIEQAIRERVEVRRAPHGRVVFVRRGAPKDPAALDADDLVSLPDIYDWKRKDKRRRYLRKKGDAGYTGPRILAEGDSWFEYPCAKDNVEWLGENYAILSLARAGDTFADIINQQSQTYPDGTAAGLVPNIAAEHPHIVMLSVGGNDILGAIETFVEPFRVDRPRDKYINADFAVRLDYVIAQYETWARQIIAGNGPHLILHGYDYPDPREGADGGQWIGGPLEHQRRIGDHTLWRQIANTMLDRLDARLTSLAGSSGGKVHYVKLLGVIGTDDYVHGPDRSLWWDELHGTSDGFERLARQLRKKIDDVWRVIGGTV